MSDSIALAEHQHQPKTIYLKDYQAPNYWIDDIALEFDLNDNGTKVASKMRVRRNTEAKERQLILNGDELILESIKINGQELEASAYHLTPTNLIIDDVPEQFELEINTLIYPEKNTALSGLYRSGDTYCTQCEAEGFRRITFYMDHPDVLSRFTTTITADESRYPALLSNGNLIASGKLEGGRHWATWEDPFKKPSYLFALVAGDFDLLQDKFITQSGREIDLRIYVEKGYGDQADHALYCVKQAMRWDEEAFGREYDLDVYMIVAIGDFNMGAMENKGLNIFNTKYVLAKPETATDDDYIHILSVIGHEYFHNWSGNRVTCRDWFQLSLKEGLTIFRDQSFTEDVLSRAVMRIKDVTALRESQFPEDAGPLAHPVRPDAYIEINNFYTATVYNKGSEVLRMMQTILGKAKFREGMDLYFTRFDGQAVTIEDFVETMEEVSGVDLHQFRLWYSQAGTPVVVVEDNYDEKQKTYILTMTQSCPATPGQANKHPMHIPIKMGLLDQQGNDIPLYLDGVEGETEAVLHLNQAVQTFEFKKVDSRPIPSLLRNFSAPVKLEYSYADDELLFLFKHDKDAFNRWEAGQKYILRMMLMLIDRHQHNKTLALPSELAAILTYLMQHVNDKYLLSEMLTLPSEKYIGEQMAVVNVDAIHAVREFVLNELAIQLQPVFTSVYQECGDSGVYEFNMEAVGRRQLKNRCLSYLMVLPEFADLGMKQFEESLHSNMTDTLAALSGLANADSPLRAKALEQFYQTWKLDALVMDKWFAIQATSKLPDTLQHVKNLVEHKGFDLKNPNKVYALIGAFGNRNPVNFHTQDGAGYVFLRVIVHQLDKLNPQVSARMVKPLTEWRRYDKERQGLMREQLEVLAKDKTISPDLYELVSKSL
ncbi:MAG: aminopeptidase N [Gammaproteobacteria bacterium]